MFEIFGKCFQKNQNFLKFFLKQKLWKIFFKTKFCQKNILKRKILGNFSSISKFCDFLNQNFVKFFKIKIWRKFTYIYGKKYNLW